MATKRRTIDLISLWRLLIAPSVNLVGVSEMSLGQLPTTTSKTSSSSRYSSVSHFCAFLSVVGARGAPRPHKDIQSCSESTPVGQSGPSGNESVARVHDVGYSKSIWPQRAFVSQSLIGQSRSDAQLTVDSSVHIFPHTSDLLDLQSFRFRHNRKLAVAHSSRSHATPFPCDDALSNGFTRWQEFPVRLGSSSRPAIIST